ncbi:MAG: excinuclease ABC subunit UvrC [Victivallales bacterium]|nr:excinuclease ABC subunit UvrC [Victivallales bacterium]MCF7889158.1 excinuclease ABC subunit UvrC [Victivallales bacterium]
MAESSIKKFYPGDIPAKPGVYIFRDRFRKVIYVGKARNLRKRMSQYFYRTRQKGSDLKLRSLINSIFSWEYFTVRNESESLILESRLIKKYAPYYNVLMRDDKRYYLLKINLNDNFPKLSLVRFEKNDGSEYFGPFPHGRVLKELISFLSGYFKIRQCNFYNPGEKERKHCIDAHVKKCCEPCIGKVSRTEYLEKVQSLLSILNGRTDEIIDSLKNKMQKYAEKHSYEKAAEVRDIIQNINEVFREKNRSFKFTTLTQACPEVSLGELRSVLDLKNMPRTIEAFDISNFGEMFGVAGLVTFTDGKPDKSKYKRFRIKTVEGINDFAMMAEVIKRHFTRKIEEDKKMPDLLMVDGGKGQLSTAIKTLVEIGAPPFPVIGLAKKYEEVFLPGKSEAVAVNKNSAALKLLQSIRDEAHRFAVSYNRKIRLRRISESILDDIPGIGEKRKHALLSSFHSVSQIKRSSPRKVCEKVNSIGIELAEQIVTYLNKTKKR